MKSDLGNKNVIQLQVASRGMTDSTGGVSGDDSAGRGSDDDPSPDGESAAQVAPEAASDEAEVSAPASRIVTEYVPPPPVPMFKNRRRLTPEEAEAQRKRRAIRRRRRRIAGLSLAGVGLGIILIGAWVGWRTYQAYSHLQAASDQVSRLQAEIKDVTAIDLTATDATVAKLQDEASKAQSAVSDPFYRAASHMPWVGPNLEAIGEVTGTVQSLSSDVVPSLVKIAQTLKPSALTPKNGVFDLGPIEAASPLLQKADAAVNASRIRLSKIDRSKVVEQVNDAVLKLWSKLDDAASITSTGARVARLLPPMMGASGARTYLVVFQNLAETRSTGGIFGSYAAIRVDQGRMTLLDKGRASRELGTFFPPIVKLGAKADNLYDQLLGIYPQDVNLTPDFPTAASLFAKMYTTRKNIHIDGVIATDPVALSYALKGVGAVDVGKGVTLTSSNIVQTLLSSAYGKFANDEDQAQRDAFLASATATAFTRVMSGSGDASVIFSGLKQAAKERRVLVWSSDAQEQADIAQTSLAGSLPTTTDQPSIGVFLNDSIGSKLGYYLTNSVSVAAGECQPDGRRQLKVSVALRYDPPTAGLPGEVLGSTAQGLRYILPTNVLIFAPIAGGVVSAAENGEPTGIHRGEELGREVGEVTLTLNPGTSSTLEMTVLAPNISESSSHRESPSLILTPGVRPWSTTVASFEAC